MDHLDKLTRERIEPEHMNDKVPGKSLDELFELDVSKVYFEPAIKTAEHPGLLMLCTDLEICHTSRRWHIDF